MRVPTITLYQSSQYQLNKTAADLQETNVMVSSGKRINKISDDPVGAVQVLSITSTLSYLGQLERNIGTGSSWLTNGESTLTTVQEGILDAKEIALTMANSIYGSEDRASAAESLDQIIMTMMDAANKKINGQYLFSGTKTDTQPYVFDDPDDPTHVIYQGNSSHFSIKTGQNSTMAVGYTGTEVFGNTDTGEDLFSLLFQMQEDLTSNDGENIDYFIEELDVHFNRVVDTISDIGTKGNRIDAAKTSISELSITLTTRKSELEDVDIVEAVTTLQQQQTAYEAALSATSAIMSLSLVDYL